MEKLSDKLYNWASEIDEVTKHQAFVTSKLPIIAGHVALMPDAHLGIGATIGSVIPTKSSIIPSAVGVDLGCFVGDIKVPLLDGSQQTLRDLAERIDPFWVYSMDSSLKIVPGRAVAKRTRTNADLVSVVISGGDEIVCTPDHLFMLSNGAYKEAKDLRFNDSLMPLWHMKDEHTNNHKVISVHVLDRKEDVFCLEVEEHHNFALAAGIFVHNCGMIAVQMNFKSNRLPEDGNKILSGIQAVVPAGLGKWHGTASSEADSWLRRHPNPTLTSDQEKKCLVQFGTLGSGNHFFEVCLDQDDQVWVVMHSGSRGVGNQLAMGHIKVAKAVAKLGGYSPEDPELAWLQENTPEFDAYIRDMQWAQDYAMANRHQMMEAALGAVVNASGGGIPSRWVNCHHNFAQKEVHGGQEVWVTRKGAIKADVGDEGVIPGSMGGKSYIVRGLGNTDSYTSCSHGAGRKMSRTQAKKTLSLESFHERMGSTTWQRGMDEALLDEHPDSYKDLDQVMDDQKDLVEITHSLHAVVNMKGTS